MALIQCYKGHFYDDVKYHSCPYCKQNIDNSIEQGMINNQSMNNIIEDAQKTIGYFEDIDSFDKTIGIYAKEKKNMYVSGWLVVKSGELKGLSFTLHEGKNFVGRTSEMDVMLTDLNVSRKNHFSIVYDNKACEFYIVEGTAPVMLNGKTLSGFEKVSEDDEIAVGNIILIFIPYCKKGRQWNE